MDNENKKSYLEKLAEKLIEWDSKIDELKGKALDATSDIEGDYNKIADDLRAKRKDAERKIDELKAASEDGWEDIKIGAEKAVNELKDAVSSAISKFKE